jgi:acyl-CoA reductase-like NAD-dependent aldehyde dehydrogenase
MGLHRVGTARRASRKGFEYAKQRRTAYPRYVVQRRLSPAFLDTYLPVVEGLRFGHPLVGAGRFLDGQDTSAYVAPACVLEPPANWSLHHDEPFGPLDSVVCVDTEAELLAAMNASNGCLVASLATDDMDFASRVAEQLQAFKVGINRPRSRGDREEVFGGIGESWKGAFVGGDLLVQAVTYGPDGEDERLFGNFPDYSQFPSR